MENRKKGFSLVELIVTVAILGILTVIFVPNMIAISDNQKVIRDDVKLQSVADAIKVALGDEEIQHEITDYINANGTFTITFESDSEGNISWQTGTVRGKTTRVLKDTKLWLGMYQTTDFTYECQNHGYYNKKFVFSAQAKTDSTTAKCTFSVE